MSGMVVKTYVSLYPIAKEDYKRRISIKCIIAYKSEKHVAFSALKTMFYNLKGYKTWLDINSSVELSHDPTRWFQNPTWRRSH